MMVRAQGEAKSAELIGEAIKKSRSYVHLREFENARAVASILQNSRNKVYLNAEALGLNVSNESQDQRSRQ